MLLTIASLHVGEKISVKALRDGKEMMFQVTVAERKDKPEIASTKESKGYFGITAQEITAEIASQLGIPRDAGVIITDVEEGSPADDVGIQPQDIIVQINKVKVTSMKEYTKEMKKASEKKNVTLLVKRGKSSFFVRCAIE